MHMKTGTRQLIQGSLALMGTIVGAGVFAVPLAFQKTGIFAGSIVYWLVALAILTIHLLYADLIVAFPELVRKRLPGQAQFFLGSWARWVAFLSHPTQVIGACLAYIILGGQFLNGLARIVGADDHLFLWQLVFWAGGAIVLFWGLRVVAKIEAWMSWGLVALLLVSSALFASQADGMLFGLSHWSGIFAPIGVFVFAVFGLPVITEVVSICGRDLMRSRIAVATGSLSAALFTWLFGIFSVAAAGSSDLSSPADLAGILHPSFVWLISAVGFFAVATSFITMTQDVKETFHLDAGVSKFLSWVLALGIPLALFLFVTKDFLQTVSLVGLVFGTTNAVLVLLMSREATRRLLGKKRRWIHAMIPLILSILFIGVAIWSILHS